MLGLASSAVEVIRTSPRELGRRLQGLTVTAGNRCSGVPKRSSDKGWTWNWILARSCAASDFVTAIPQSHRAIYSYSFALKPEENQPSGTCNFSRIDTATIVMNMSGNYVVDENTDNVWNVRVYAINYNILRVMSGMAGLAYSN